MLQKRLSEAAKKRLRAGRMLQKGRGCGEVALAVARQTVYTWKALLDEGGIDALRAVPEPGRPARLDQTQLASVRAALLQGPAEHGVGAEQENRLIVFVDESGISEQPTRVRTWALKGKTPIIGFHFNWTHVPVIAGLKRTNCLFRLHEGSIRKEEIVEFLKTLKAHLSQPPLVIRDGLKAHKSRLVRGYLDTLDGATSRSPLCRPMRPTSMLWSICGPGSSAIRWPTTVPTISKS